MYFLIELVVFAFAGYGIFTVMSKLWNHVENDTIKKFKLKDKRGEYVTFEFKKIVEGAKLPIRKRKTDAGYDIFSNKDVTIPPHGIAWIGTGIQVSAPPNYYFTLDGRSGMGKDGIQPFRGIIDSGFTGEMSCLLFNSSDKPYKVENGHRIAQLVPHKQIHLDFKEVGKFSPKYNSRGDVGWGSSGK